MICRQAMRRPKRTNDASYAMDRELLKQAQRGLRIRDVFQVAAHASVPEGHEYNPATWADESPAVQTKHLVRQTVVLEPEDDEDAPDLFRVYIDLGIRWKASGDAPDDNEESWAEIGATYIAEYEMRDELKPESLSAFALHNASFHVWPFFREFVASQCQRMNFPKIIIPMMRLASNRDVDPESVGEKD